ncbi:MAG: hypothetical protein ABIX46_05890, partial [Burkholderiaceae bacterium]
GMPIVYLEPRDLSVLQAQTVLDFLNRATSAQQLARDIEFPREPDIGVRLGQRLLDARAALGGAYTAIGQVRAVRLIGPERFTEICVAALGYSPERWAELFYGGTPASAPTENGLALALEVRPQPAWLGQSLALTLRISDAGGTPRAGVAVALQTGAGTLVWMYGYTRVEGQAITVLSGADGTADVELVRAPSEPLSELQQAAFDTAFTALDATAPDPIKLEADFRALADLYLLERSYNLRRAIDIHVRDRREAMLASINPGTWRFAWPVDSVLVQADALAAGGGGNTVARAVRTVEWKNWVGAWLEFFADALREGAGLDAKFGQALGRAGSAEVLVDLLGQAQRFVADQSGRTAQWLGQKTIDSAVARVVSSDLDNVAPAAREAVLTQLEVAAREVSPTALGSYTLVRHTRKELLGSVSAFDALSLERLGRAEALVAQVDTQAARIETLALQVQRTRSQIDSDVTRFSTDYSRFNTDLADFNRTRPGVVISPVSPGIGGVSPGVVISPVVPVSPVIGVGVAPIVRRAAPAKKRKPRRPAPKP